MIREGALLDSHSTFSFTSGRFILCATVDCIKKNKILLYDTIKWLTRLYFCATVDCITISNELYDSSRKYPWICCGGRKFEPRRLPGGWMGCQSVLVVKKQRKKPSATISILQLRLVYFLKIFLLFFAYYTVILIILHHRIMQTTVLPTWLSYMDHTVDLCLMEYIDESFQDSQYVLITFPRNCQKFFLFCKFLYFGY